MLPTNHSVYFVCQILQLLVQARGLDTGPPLVIQRKSYPILVHGKIRLFVCNFRILNQQAPLVKYQAGGLPLSSWMQTDALALVAEFAGDALFLNVGPVCQDWWESWDHATTTEKMTRGMSVAMLEEGFEAGLQPDESFSNYFATHGEIELLEHAMRNKCAVTKKTCELAAGKGHLPVLKLLRGGRRKCKWTDTTFTAAAQSGHLNIIEWAWENYCPRDGGVGISLCAAIGGHQHIIDWCRPRGLNNYNWTIAHAAEKGRLTMLHGLREEGCVMDECTCTWTKDGPRSIRMKQTNEICAVLHQ